MPSLSEVQTWGVLYWRQFYGKTSMTVFQTVRKTTLNVMINRVITVLMTALMPIKIKSRCYNDPTAVLMAMHTLHNRVPNSQMAMFKKQLRLCLPPASLSVPFLRRQENKRTDTKDESIIVMVFPDGEWSWGRWHIHPYHTQRSTPSPLSASTAEFLYYSI